MEKYLLLRNNELKGPLSFENLVQMGLLPHDLVWIEGKSASWKYPAEIDEFKIYVPSVSSGSKDASRPPITKTHFLNDDLLVRGLQPVTPEKHIELPDNELLEFPTLARFFMSAHYARQEKNTAVEKIAPEQPQHKEQAHAHIWVSMPARAEKPKVILISGETVKESAGHRPDNIHAQIQPSPEQISEHTATIPLHTIDTGQEHDSKIHFMPIASRRKPLVSLQWLSIAVAVASLLMVGLLIVNSIINPGYETKTLSGSRTPDVKDKAQPGAVTDPQAGHAVFTGSETHTGVALPVSADSAQAALLKNNPAEEPSPADKKITVKKQVEKKTATPPAETVSMDTLTVKREETPANAEEKVVNTEKEEARKNISHLVQIQMDGYKVGIFGGIREFDVVVKNNSDFPIDRVVVELKFIQSNKKVFKTEILEFNDIAARSDRRIEVPKSSRGVKVETQIRSIASDDLNLSYSN